MKMINRTEKIITRVDRYLSLMRYQYTSQEQLSRLNAIKDLYLTLNKKPTEEKLCSKVIVEESLSKDLKLPLKVRGIFLKEGRPQRRYYTIEEMKKACDNPINQRFPLMLDHKDKEAGKVVGIVTKIQYDEKLGGIRWWGHINSELFARNVLDKAISEVSATIFSTEEYTDLFGLIGTDLTFKELSLVQQGAVIGNSIEPY